MRRARLLLWISILWMLPLPSPAADGAWLVVDAPAKLPETTRLPILEVRGHAGPASRGTDLVIVLDLSASTLHSTDVDLDEDGPQGGTDPSLIAWIETQKDAPIGLARRLREHDFDDSILAAELEATAALIERLDLRRFRVGIVIFSNEAQLVAPPGSPRPALEKALAEIRRGFFRQLHGTNLAAAIEVAHKALLPEEDWSPRDRQRVIVLLSDGAPTLPPFGDRALRASIEAAMSAGVDGIRIFPFSIGRAAEKAQPLLERMAAWSGGRHQHVAQPYETALRVRELDLTNLKQLSIANATTGRPARAVRTFADGSFDAIVALAPGPNRILVQAQHRDGTRYEVSRMVERESGEVGAAEHAEAQRLLEALRRRTRETELWADLERRRRMQMREVEIGPQATQTSPSKMSNASPDAPRLGGALRLACETPSSRANVSSKASMCCLGDVKPASGDCRPSWTAPTRGHR